MNDLLDIATTPLLLVLCALAGAAAPRQVAGTFAARTVAFRLALRVIIGVVALHGWMLLLDLFGVQWTRLTVIAPLVLAAGIGCWSRLRRSHREPRPAARMFTSFFSGFFSGSFSGRLPAWGDVLVLGALGGFAILLLRPCLTMPDVVFHWGIKVQRSVLVGGIDYAFMQQPWNFNKHADYPYLVPNLYAAGAILRGRYTELTFLPWTLAYVALLAAGVREAFAGRRDFAAQATLVIAVFVTTAFAIGHLLGGSPDLLLAAVLVAAIPAVLGPVLGFGTGSRDAVSDDAAREAQIGWLAALAVGAKYEGGPLAILLVLACLWQWRRMGLAVRFGTLCRLVVPSVVVAGIWWQQILRLGLAQGNRAAGFDLSRTRAIGEGVIGAITHPSWQGFGWSVMLLPLLLLCGRVRPMAAVVLAQVTVYAWVYFTTPLDVATLIATSAERLLLHAVPVTLVLGGLVLGTSVLGASVLGASVLGSRALGSGEHSERAQRPPTR